MIPLGTYSNLPSFSKFTFISMRITYLTVARWLLKIRVLVYLQDREGQRIAPKASEAPFPLFKNQNAKAFQKTCRKLHFHGPELWYMALPINKGD